MVSKSTDENAVLAQHPRHIIQNFLLVWLDADIKESTPDTKSLLMQLQRIIVSIEIYKSVEECIQFIQQTKGQKVFMIVSGTLGQEIVPKITKWPQIDSIYVFCKNIPVHKLWAKDYPIIKGVHSDMQLICDALQIDRRRCDQKMMPVSFQDSDPLFMYSQLLKEAILQIEDNDDSFIKELAEFYRNQNDIPEAEIQWIEKEYYLHKPIWWYKAPSILYSTLNHGFKVFDVDILLKMGFFVRHLHCHIQELYREQQLDPSMATLRNTQFEVYRGQGLSREDFEKLQRTKGGLMSFNNFLSTSYKKTESLRNFARPAVFMTDFFGILFVMKIDTDLCKKANIPFAEVSGKLGFFENKEVEILFTTHTLFRIDRIEQLPDPLTDRLYEIHLTLTSSISHEFHQIEEKLRKEMENRNGLSRLGFLLSKAKQSDQAERLYQILLERAVSPDDKAEYNQQLGLLYKNKGEYQKALTFYQNCLETKIKTLPPNHCSLVVVYDNMGELYCSMGEYSKAISSYQQSIELQKGIPHSSSNNLAQSYSNLGFVYYNIDDYSNALLSYEQSLDIKKQTLPLDYLSLAITYNNIGVAYESMGKYIQALSSYQQSVEYQKQVLRLNHPDFVSNYKNIARLYYNMGEYSKALSLHQLALEIQQQVLPERHLDLAASYNNIGIIYKSIGEYSKALLSYQQSLEIQQQILHVNDPELASIYNNIGNVHYTMGNFYEALCSHTKALEIRENALPSNHPNTATTYNNIANVCYKMGELSNALKFYGQALHIWQSTLPPGHPHLAIAKNNVEVVQKLL